MPVRFSEEGVLIGNDLLPLTSVSVAGAVAASSSFPPVFAPYSLSFENPRKIRRELQKKAKTISDVNQPITDGGIYDNSGFSQVEVDSEGNDGLVIVSDAGAPFVFEDKRFNGLGGRLARCFSILMSRVDSLLLERMTAEGVWKRALHIKMSTDIPSGRTPEGFSEVEGWYSNLRGNVEDGLISEEFSKDLGSALAVVRTDFDRFSNAEISALIAHAYRVTLCKLKESKSVNDDVLERAKLGVRQHIPKEFLPRSPVEDYDLSESGVMKQSLLLPLWNRFRGRSTFYDVWLNWRLLYAREGVPLITKRLSSFFLWGIPSVVAAAFAYSHYVHARNEVKISKERTFYAESNAGSLGLRVEEIRGDLADAEEKIATLEASDAIDSVRKELNLKIGDIKLLEEQLSVAEVSASHANTAAQAVETRLSKLTTSLLSSRLLLNLGDSEGAEYFADLRQNIFVSRFDVLKGEIIETDSSPHAWTFVRVDWNESKDRISQLDIFLRDVWLLFSTLDQTGCEVGGMLFASGDTPEGGLKSNAEIAQDWLLKKDAEVKFSDGDHDKIWNVFSSKSDIKNITGFRNYFDIEFLGHDSKGDVRKIFGKDVVLNDDSVIIGFKITNLTELAR